MGELVVRKGGGDVVQSDGDLHLSPWKKINNILVFAGKIWIRRVSE